MAMSGNLNAGEPLFVLSALLWLGNGPWTLRGVFSMFMNPMPSTKLEIPTKRRRYFMADLLLERGSIA